eukprot:TRINITY_DN35038_c0_g1_i1.p1 TRINITY_DN35038_c0_g1~~TRINITY_DN35038_c0_g1_i1.p1  ORF type:complete len:362 (-),score=77.21 TRINITY_DN35038_c0_g1_i1:93-1127(-)
MSLAARLAPRRFGFRGNAAAFTWAPSLATLPSSTTLRRGVAVGFATSAGSDDWRARAGGLAIALAASVVAAAGGASLRCEDRRVAASAAAASTSLPPRPVCQALRPEVDPRIDASAIIRFDPLEHLRTGAAIIVLPGGNYEELAMKHEGHQVAVWLNSLGITAIVLRYRLLPEGHYWPAQLEDLSLTMKIVRDAASEWRIDADRVGVLGFSAGGHLAGSAAVARDAVVRPNAQILVYPCIDVTKPEWWPWTTKEGFPPPEASVHLQAGAHAPAAFLAVSTEDGLCTAEDNTEPYAQKLRDCGVPVEHLVQPMGKHGHGLKGGWTETCEAWLVRLGWAASAAVRV